MSDRRKQKRPNRTRHAQNCQICSHPQREDIEREFLDWQSPARIAEEHGLGSRIAVYRHAAAFALTEKRDRNIKAALSRFIERGDRVEVSAASFVSAIQAYSKINAQGHWIERSEHLNLNELFERMTAEELEQYAKDGKLPAWFPRMPFDTAAQTKENVSD